MPSHIKTYDGSEDPEDYLKIFQAAAKIERWPMPTWCHMFNSTLTGNARVWFDDLPQESIDSYDDLKKAFLENYLQQKNESKILFKFTTSSREMGNPWKNLCGEERWRPLIMNGISHFRYGNSKKPDKVKLQEGRLPDPTKARAKAEQVYPYHKNTKRNYGFGQGEV
ncbi:reverse transcriptase domain-containing protein [Tanacetum coccineum]